MPGTVGGGAKPTESSGMGEPRPELGLESSGRAAIRLRTRFLIRLNKFFGLPSEFWSEVPESSPAGGDGEGGEEVEGVLEVDLPPFFVPPVFFFESEEGAADLAGLILSEISRNHVKMHLTQG